MAAPSSTTWGSVIGSYGRIGIYTGVSSSNTTITVNVEIWFWSKYSVSDTSNTLYFDNLSSSGSASTSRGSVSINTTVDSGDGWSTSNQLKLKSYSYSYTRTTTASTRYLYAKLANVDRVGGTMYASKSVSIPKLASYTISYNANGGSGAPSSQTKWYGKSLTLSTTKPTRTGYSFQGWATSSSGSVAYSSGASYTANAGVTLYAVWKANTYTISYNANGGSGAPSKQTKTYGVTLKLSTTIPTKDNYTFKGWSTSASATSATYAAGGNYTANSGATLYAVWELAYTKPVISSFSAIRCDADGTVNDEGVYINVKFNWSCFLAVSTIRIDWRSASETIWNMTLISSEGTSGSVDTIVGNGEINPELTYTVRANISDENGSRQSTKTLNGSIFVFDGLAGGTGAAIGKAAELDGYFDVGFSSRFRKSIHMDNNLSIYGTHPDGATDILAFQAQNSNGNVVIGYGNYDKKTGNTNIYGYDLNLGVSNIASPRYFRPYKRQGDSITVSLRTAGYVTNNGKDVSFLVPFAVPIIGSPTVEVASINGFTLRQSEKYTHGSSATAYITPDSYTTHLAPWNGIYITASFTNTTNVINNNAIGIYWNGTITFS